MIGINMSLRPIMGSKMTKEVFNDMFSNFFSNNYDATIYDITLQASSV